MELPRRAELARTIPLSLVLLSTGPGPVLAKSLQKSSRKTSYQLDGTVDHTYHIKATRFKTLSCEN